MKKIFSLLLKLLLVVFILLVISEIGLRIAGYFYINQAIASNKDCDPNNINILCLGESTTLGLGVDWLDSYPKKLEKKLIDYYRNDKIKVIVPPHVGQNTSQILNRINFHLKLYKPKLIILMTGVNNEWSLGESNIVRFLNSRSPDRLKIKLIVAANNLRLFKILRYFFIKSKILDILDQTNYMPSTILGTSDTWRYPPVRWIYKFALKNRPALTKGWLYDMTNIIRKAKSKKANVLLMTYHFRVYYLPEDAFPKLAEQEKIPLVRNDLSFQERVLKGDIDKYLLSSDHWHPNKAGYAIIANNAFETIKSNNLLRLN